MSQVTVPYLTVRGAADAIAFYQKAFGATETARHPADDGKRLLHASLDIRGGSVFLSDEFPEHGGHAPKSGEHVPAAVAIALKAPADVDAMFKQAVAAGAKATMAPNDTFWGSRFAMLDDPFGHHWMLDAPLKT